MPPMIDLNTITHVFLTGAGISAESGLPTFRGVDGLWRNHRPEVLADIRTWRTNYDLVHAFYSMRRNTQNTKGKTACLTARQQRGTHLHPGHFSMENPGQISVQINNRTQ